MVFYEINHGVLNNIFVLAWCLLIVRGEAPRAGTIPWLVVATKGRRGSFGYSLLCM
jgi:hypothetical protein